MSASVFASLKLVGGLSSHGLSFQKLSLRAARAAAFVHSCLKALKSFHELAMSITDGVEELFGQCLRKLKTKLQFAGVYVAWRSSLNGLCWQKDLAASGHEKTMETIISFGTTEGLRRRCIFSFPANSMLFGIPQFVPQPHGPATYPMVAFRVPQALPPWHTGQARVGGKQKPSCPGVWCYCTQRTKNKL